MRRLDPRRLARPRCWTALLELPLLLRSPAAEEDDDQCTGFTAARLRSGARKEKASESVVATPRSRAKWNARIGD
jgi:hypothetical protein